MNKINVFNTEYKYIKNSDNVTDIKYIVNLLPDYFFEVPASSTGKYHPEFAGTKNGLVKHTKVAVRIAHELLENDSIGSKFSDTEKDLIIMALIIHDGIKCGNPKEEWTRFDHPLLISKMVMENKDKLKLKIDDLRKLCSIIESHMGQWNINPKTKEEVLPKPKNELAKFVHMCDYLSSKKFINVKFNGIEIEG